MFENLLNFILIFAALPEKAEQIIAACVSLYAH